ncbi:transforming growth factor-beta-induced protein ig-h3 [Coccinella septempunctata]|uniref:transforming growth factor-beta-induced protein ig-h3 n=1 Tax=Coccinella septempunctata TaxID=41139 RepID=UPI001D08A3CA|nr:transforming growth factor-beta-induced protein ig-h3 [Coccinella septempunctata]
MLWKAFVFGVLLASGVRARNSLFGPQDDSLFSSWSDLATAESRNQPRDVEPVTERDREPLSPDYKDPSQRKNEKPVVPSQPNKPSFDESLIPGGVIDIPAGGFPPIFGDPFRIPTLNERPGGIFDFDSDELGLPGFNGQNPGGLFGNFFSSLGEVRPWWKGPNVCIEREESTDDETEEEGRESSKNETESEEVPNFFSTSISLSNCHQTPAKYECVTKVNNHGVVKTFTVRYKCCYGYARQEGSIGCNRRVELKPLLQTLSDLNANEFKKLIEDNGLVDRFKNENLTVFAPLDQSMNEYNDKMNQFNDLNPNPQRKKRDLKNILSSDELVWNHVTDGFVDLTELINEEIIHNENQNNSIRINNYPTQNYDRLVTANCKRIAKANNLASNGIVHLVDGVMTPVGESVQDIIRNDKRLSSLLQVLESTDLLKKFKDEGHYTVFAPTNEAFDKLEQSTRDKLLRGEACAKSIISHHVTAHTVCSVAIIGNSTTHNVDGNVLNMERTLDDQLILENKAKIIETDIMGTNGVVHLIDTIIIPESALFINDALKNEKLTKFQEIIEKAGLTDEINNLDNATVFAPSDEAFEKEGAKKILEEIGDDKEKLKELVRYHTVQGKMQSCDMNNNALLKTLDNDRPLRINLYSTLPIFSNILFKATVNCARISGFDEKTCGSVIHEVNKVLVPPKKTILEVVKSDPKYSKIQKIIEGTEIEEILGQENRTITFLAPTDETLAALDEDQLKSLEDKEKAVEILKTHILTEILCCSGVGPQTWGFNSLVPTLSEQNLQIGRTGTHQIRIGRGVVTSCDNLATNGVVHSINEVFFPQRHVANVGGYFLFDF